MKDTQGVFEQSKSTSMSLENALSQLERLRQHNQLAEDLTAVRQPLYAKNTGVFPVTQAMVDESVLEKEEVKQPDPAVVKTDANIPPVEQEANGINEFPHDMWTVWEKWLNSGNLSQEQRPGWTFVAGLIANGISLEQYKNNPEFYNKNKELFDLKVAHEKMLELREAWSKHFEQTPESKKEYEQKEHYINTLIAQRLSPLEFAKQYTWEAFFETPPPESAAVLIMKALLKATAYIVLDGIVPDPGEKTEAEKKEAKRRGKQKRNTFASMLWELANLRRVEQGKGPSLDEKRTQQYIAQFGVAPDKDGAARKTDVLYNAGLDEPERLEETQGLLGEMDDKQKRKFADIHNIGPVFSEDATVIWQKARQLKALQEGLDTANKYLTDEEKEKEQKIKRGALLYAGVAGTLPPPEPGGTSIEPDSESPAPEPPDEEEEEEEESTSMPQEGKAERKRRIRVRKAWDKLVDDPNGSLNWDTLNPLQKAAIDHYKDKNTLPTGALTKKIKRIKNVQDLIDLIGNQAVEDILRKANEEQEKQDAANGKNGNKVADKGEGEDEYDNMAALEAYYGRNVESMDDLMFEIVRNEPDEQWLWGENGLFPLYQRVYKKNAEGKPLDGREGRDRVPETFKRVTSSRRGQTKDEDMIRANPGNFYKWVMHQRNYWHNESPEGEVDFFNKISLRRKRGGSIPLSAVMDNKKSYLQTQIEVAPATFDTDGKLLTDAVFADYIVEDFHSQIWKDLVPYTYNRDKGHLKYLQAMKSPKELEAFMKTFHAYPSNLSRAVWYQESFLRWAYYTPQKFEAAIEKAHWKKSELAAKSLEDKEKQEMQDGKVGAAKGLAELVYRNIMNLGDSEEEEEQGDNSPMGKLLRMDPASLKRKKEEVSNSPMGKLLRMDAASLKRKKDEEEAKEKEELRKRREAAERNRLLNRNSLINLLGSDSTFFNKKKLIAIRNDLAGIREPETYIPIEGINKIFAYFEDKGGSRDNEKYLWVPNPDYDANNPDQEINNAAFDSNKREGPDNLKKIKMPREVAIDRAAFRKFFNVFNDPMRDPRREKMLRQVVANEVARKHKLYIEDKDQVTKGKVDARYVQTIDEKSGQEIYRLISDLDPRIEEDSQILEELENKKTSAWIVDDDAKDGAEQEAFFSLGWKGIAGLNDPDGTGFDFQSRVFYAIPYRLKGWGRKRMNNSGNPFNINSFRATIVDFMRGTLTLAIKPKYADKYGLQVKGTTETYKDKAGKDYLYKTPQDVLEELVHGVQIFEDEKAQIRLERIRRERNKPESGAVPASEPESVNGSASESVPAPDNDNLLSEEEVWKNERARILRDISAQFLFKQQTQEKYFDDHWARGLIVLEENLLGAKEINFEKIASYDRFFRSGKLDIDKNAFDKEFEEFMKPWRYGISTYRGLDLQQEVDMFDEEGNLIYVTDQNGNKRRPIMAQFLFGNEILDHEQFWRTAAADDPKGIEVEITDAKGETVKVRKIPHVIDPAEVNTEQGKIQLYILAGLSAFGAQMIQHRQVYAHDKYYGNLFVHAMYDALRSMPAEILYKDLPMRFVRPNGRAISDLDIKWLQEHSDTGTPKMAVISIFSAVGQGLANATMPTLKYVSGF